MLSIEILAKLIAFETVSRQSNLALIDWVADQLRPLGARIELIESEDRKCANLFATIGPDDRAGIMLSGHTDVVPVAGQAWTKPPFEMTEQDGRLFGRGTADMKGFVACAIAAAKRASERGLAMPLQLALSYDEEIGCIGVRRLIETMRQSPIRPRIAIVGEPTGLQVANGHKGKLAARAQCRGREGHSALAPLAMNAIHLATDFIQALRREQAEIASHGKRDQDYDIAYSTVHVGRIGGGTALNIVPQHCEVEFEIRHLAQDDPHQIMERLRAQATDIVAQANDADAAIEIEISNSYPGLTTPADSEAVRFVQSLTGANGTCKVAFGTEGGLFSADLAIPSVICGPGSMAQGHKPDEFITIEQMQRCDAMLDRLIDRLAEGQ